MLYKVKKERLFTNQQLLVLLWPLIIEQALGVLVGMADTVMVSSVGEAGGSPRCRWWSMINPAYHHSVRARWQPAAQS